MTIKKKEIKMETIKIKFETGTLKGIERIGKWHLTKTEQGYMGFWQLLDIEYLTQYGEYSNDAKNLLQKLGIVRICK
jgi:hypothetical protein